MHIASTPLSSKLNMQAMTSLKYTLPTFLFFSLCGFYFIIVQMTVSKAPDRFLEVHKQSAVPLNFTNGLLPLLDNFLRPLFSFFVSAFADANSPSYPTVVAFVWSFSSAIQLPLVEGLRAQPKTGAVHQSSWLTNIATRLLSWTWAPMVWAIFYQRLAGGFILPIWLFFFLHSLSRASGAPVRRAEAESALIGWWFGHTLPALAMLIPNQPALKAVPLWVAFPILMSLCQFAWLWLRTHVLRNAFGGDLRKSGYIPLQLTYASALLLSFIGHTYSVLIPSLRDAPSLTPTSVVLLNKLLGLFHALFSFFLAPFGGPFLGLAPPSPSTTTAASGVAHFVQCDVLVVFSAVWVALLWDLAQRRRAEGASVHGTVKWLFGTTSALLIGGLLFSPGAATGMLLMYREAHLESARRGHDDAMDECAPLLGSAQTRMVREKNQIRAATI